MVSLQLLIAIQTCAQNKTIIQLIHKVGNEPLFLQKEYTNSLGEVYTINRFKYYISNIRLQHSNQQITNLSNQYFLIDEADSNTKKIVLSINASDITSISLMIGVDSLHQVTGVHTGSLDPKNGMFWTWNTGYVMAKLEGQSASAKVAGNIFSHHVGGYKSSENTARAIVLNTTETISKQRQIIRINVDINKWFHSAHAISITNNPICHSTGKLAMQLADNYATMFTISTE